MTSLLGYGNRGSADRPQLGHRHLVQMIQETERFLIPREDQPFNLGSLANGIPMAFMANGKGRLVRSGVRLFDQKSPWRVFRDGSGSCILLDVKFRSAVDPVGNEPHHRVKASQNKISMDGILSAWVPGTHVNQNGILRQVIRFLIQPSTDLVGQFTDVVVGDRNAADDLFRQHDGAVTAVSSSSILCPEPG